MMCLEDTWFVAAFHSTPMHDRARHRHVPEELVARVDLVAAPRDYVAENPRAEENLVQPFCNGQPARCRVLLLSGKPYLCAKRPISECWYRSRGETGAPQP